MGSDESTEVEDAPRDGGTDTGADTGAEGESSPSWWHRDHPVFVPLTGFFAGLVIVIAIPGAFGAILSALFDDETAESLFPFALVILAIPLVLLAIPRTRTFGRYLLIGMVSTAVVVIGVAALTLYVLIARDG